MICFSILCPQQKSDCCLLLSQPLYLVSFFKWMSSHGELFFNKSIFSNKNLCNWKTLTNFGKNSVLQSALFNMITLLSVSLASKCLLVHFKLFFDPEVCWIVNKVTELTFTVFCDLSHAGKHVMRVENLKVLSSRKLYLYLFVHQDSLFYNILVNFLLILWST